MPALVWDAPTKRLYHTGVDHGVLYVCDAAGNYGNGVAWNGLTNVNENPSGADSNPLYADNMKYLDLRSNEEFGFTIQAYMYPDEFEACDGLVSPIAGMSLAQQNRATFGFSYRTKVGNDTEGENYGYKLHVVYGCTASPSGKDRSTTNENPDAVQFSWEVSTVPVPVTIDGKEYKPTAHIEFDSKTLGIDAMEALEAMLYGTEAQEAHLPTPLEIYTELKKHVA